jgi:hypothetical protein
VITLLLNHPLLLSVSLFILLTAAVDAGFRVATWSGANLDEERREQVASSRDALGILLSLLLGFTLALATPHYELRKQLVMDEANAISTTSLRAGMLPEPQRSQIRALLLQYVQARREYSLASPDKQELSSVLHRAKELQSALWQQAEAAARQSPTPFTSLFVASLNETIDLSEKRLTAMESRVPPAVWLLLLCIALLTCLTFGYHQRKRFWLLSVVTPLMIAIAMGLIADLDSPRSGFLRVDLRSLERLAQDLRVEAPPPPTEAPTGMH